MTTETVPSKTYEVQYHQQAENRYITEWTTMRADSPQAAADFLFKHVRGMRWVRIEGVTYGKSRAVRRYERQRNR